MTNFMHAPITAVRAIPCALLAALCVLFAGPPAAHAETPHPEWRGMLANPGFQGQAMKGIYFFAGEGDPAQGVYTAHPQDARDMHWNSAPDTRSWVMGRIAATHVNTIQMSYWSDMPEWSPMIIDPSGGTLPGVLDAVQGKPLVIMPALEGGYDSNHPDWPHWEFQKDFPHPSGDTRTAPGLIGKVGELVNLFKGRMNLWARLYDRDGMPRYAVQILHACSDNITRDDGSGDDDADFAQGFDQAAAIIALKYHILVGFTLDTVSGCGYTAIPAQAGPALEHSSAVLAIEGYASEVFSGLVQAGAACDKPADPAPAGDWQRCEVRDNNANNNISAMADWKRDALRDWLATGVPVILDVTNGFDGRKVWAYGSGGIGVWGDNLTATDDRWRNWMSELKSTRGTNGAAIKGISFDTWNGYTEGYSAVPTTEHGVTVYNWLTDLMAPPPWDCSHVHYVNTIRSHHVFGAICDKWLLLGADRGYGPPISEELPSRGKTGRVSFFADGKGIFWSGDTQAHELHGLIALTYEEAGEDKSCLGLPTSDEMADGDGRVSLFQHGRITWRPGDGRGQVICQ